MQHVKVLIYVLAAVTKCPQHARLEVATFTTPRLHPACIQAIKTCVEYPHHQIITLSFLDPATPTLGAPTESACSTNLIDLTWLPNRRPSPMVVDHSILRGCHTHAPCFPTSRMVLDFHRFPSGGSGRDSEAFLLGRAGLGVEFFFDRDTDI